MRNRRTVARRPRKRTKPPRAKRRKQAAARAATAVFKALVERIHHTEPKIAASSKRAIRGLLKDEPALLEALGLEIPRGPGRPKGKRSIPFREAVTVAVAVDHVGVPQADVIRALGREARPANYPWLKRRLEYGRTAPEWWLESVLLRHLRGRPKAEQREFILERVAYYRKK